MFRYRMSSKPIRFGWALAVFIIGLLLIILASQLGGGQQNVTSQPTSTGTSAGGQAPGVLMQLWQEIRVGVASLWSGLTGTGQAKQVDISLEGDLASGYGTEEEDVPGEDVTVVIDKPPVPDAFLPNGQSPQVLIYHTHTHEAYTRQDGQDYVEVAKWRTVDNGYNVVKVGEALARELSGKFGIAVLHDKTDNEYPKLGTSYARSLKVVQMIMDDNKDLKILIDLHRDAYNTNINPPSATINGVNAAKIMMVIGTGEGQTGVGFTLRPDWKKNLALADAITDRLKEFDAQLVRKTSVKTGRYNQHLSAGSILIEVGHNKNTLEEALNTVPFLAQAIADAYNSMTDGAAPAATATPGVTAGPNPTATPNASATPAATSHWPAASPDPGATGPAVQVIIIDPEVTARPRPVE